MELRCCCRCSWLLPLIKMLLLCWKYKLLPNDDCCCCCWITDDELLLSFLLLFSDSLIVVEFVVESDVVATALLLFAYGKNDVIFALSPKQNPALDTWLMLCWLLSINPFLLIANPLLFPISCAWSFGLSLKLSVGTNTAARAAAQSGFIVWVVQLKLIILFSFCFFLVSWWRREGEKNGDKFLDQEILWWKTKMSLLCWNEMQRIWREFAELFARFLRK